MQDLFYLRTLLLTFKLKMSISSWRTIIVGNSPPTASHAQILKYRIQCLIHKLQHAILKFETNVYLSLL